MIIMERLRFYLACTKPRIMEGTALPGIPQRIMILYDVNLYCVPVQGKKTDQTYS